MRITRPSLGAWIVGTPVGVLLGTVVVGLGLVGRPDLLLGPLHGVAARGGHALHVGRVALERPDAWDPGTWRYVIEDFCLVGARGKAPSVLIDRAEVGFPRTGRLGDGDVDVPWVRLVGFTLAWLAPVTPKDGLPPPGPALRVVVHHADVEGFELVMAGDDTHPRVVIDPTDGRIAPFTYDLRTHAMTGAMQARTAQVDVAGVMLRDVHAPSFALAGDRMILAASATLAGQPFDATMTLVPLMGGRPTVSLYAHVSRGDLAPMLREAMGDDLGLRARATAWGWMTIPPRPSLETITGRAVVDLVDTAIHLPDTVGQGVVGVLDLLRFLDVDRDARDVLLGPVSGEVNLVDGRVALTELYYLSDLSLARFDGHVGPAGIDVRARFRPRAGSGAVPWGFTVKREPEGKPKIGLLATGPFEAVDPVGPRAPARVRAAFAEIEAAAGEPHGASHPGAHRRGHHRKAARAITDERQK